MYKFCQASHGTTFHLMHLNVACHINGKIYFEVKKCNKLRIKPFLALF